MTSPGPGPGSISDRLRRGLSLIPARTLTNDALVRYRKLLPRPSAACAPRARTSRSSSQAAFAIMGIPFRAAASFSATFSGPSPSNIFNRKGDHLVRPHSTRGFLLHPFTQVRVREPEIGVLRELRVACGHKLASRVHKVHVVDGVAPRVEKGRHKDHPVNRSRQLGGQGVHLRGEVAAQRAVAPRVSEKSAASLPRGGAEISPHLVSQGRRLGSRQAAGVRRDEKQGLGESEGFTEGAHRPFHEDPHPVDCLRAGRIIVYRDKPRSRPQERVPEGSSGVSNAQGRRERRHSFSEVHGVAGLSPRASSPRLQDDVENSRCRALPGKTLGLNGQEAVRRHSHVDMGRATG